MMSCALYLHSQLEHSYRGDERCKLESNDLMELAVLPSLTFYWHDLHKLKSHHIEFAKRARWTRLEDVQLRPNGIHFMHAEPHMSNADIGTVLMKHR